MQLEYIMTHLGQRIDKGEKKFNNSHIKGQARGWSTDRDERYADRNEEVDRGSISLNEMAAGSTLSSKILNDPSNDQKMTSKQSIARFVDETLPEVIKPFESINRDIKLVTCAPFVTVFQFV